MLPIFSHLMDVEWVGERVMRGSSGCGRVCGRRSALWKDWAGPGVRGWPVSCPRGRPT